ncbi:hypothetical protein DK66_3125 [Brucella suis 1330]|nr:hypothetical protein DK66_3125 [Brucella suis 1330]
MCACFSSPLSRHHLTGAYRRITHDLKEIIAYFLNLLIESAIISIILSGIHSVFKNIIEKW